MNINQKGFANVLIIILIVVIIGTVGYFTLIRKPMTLPIDQSQSIPPQQPVINNQLQNSLTSSEQIDWKTYSDASLGYSVKYPEDWFLYENDQVIEIAPDIDPRSVEVFPYIHIYKKIDNRKPDSIKEDELKKNPATMAGETLIDGRIAYYFTYPSGILSVFYVKHSNNFLVITAQSSQDIDLEYSREIKKILSTFKFTKYTPSTNDFSNSQEAPMSQMNKMGRWQVYKNDQYGFSFRYPIDWNIIAKENDTSLGSLVSVKIMANQTGSIGRDEFLGLVGCFGGMNNVDPFYLGDFHASELIKIAGVATSIYKDQNRGLETLRFYIPLIKQDSQRCGIFFQGFTDLTETKKDIINSLEFSNSFEAFVGSVFKQFQTKPPTKG